MRRLTARTGRAGKTARGGIGSAAAVEAIAGRAERAEPARKNRRRGRGDRKARLSAGRACVSIACPSGPDRRGRAAPRGRRTQRNRRFSAVLHALTEAVCSPAAPADSQPTVNSESVSLRVEVLSGGPLTGAQMIVAA